MLGTGFVSAQRTVSGTITDESGTPLIGANIVAKEVAGVGTITDIDGNFKLDITSGVKTLVFSYAGFGSKEIALGESNIINVTLSEGQVLEELLVVGYGTKTTRFNTQSVTALGANNIKNRPVLSPQELLQGQAAGVQMVNSSGVLGAQSSVRIRGSASITGGGQPLFVVDGVPLNDEVRSTAQGGGTGLNPLMNINSNDIESMTVLKDAAAVSIYGSRGANGVIIIKTKRGGSKEKTTIGLDVSSGVSDPTNLITMMNTNQFIEYNNAYRSARNLAPQTLATDYFDWPTAVVQQGKSDQVNLSASGGTEKTTYYMGGSFVKESGFTIGNESERLAGRINFDHKANDWLTIGTNLSTSKVDMDRIGVENNTFAPLTSAYLQVPNVTPFNADGTFKNTGFIQNVLAIEALNTNTFVSKRTTGNVYADIKLLNGLVFRTDWGMDNAETTAKTRAVNLLTPGGSASRDISNDNKWLTTNTLKFDKEIGSSSFGVLAGYSFETSRFLNVFVSGNGFATDDLPNVASASTPTSTFEAGSRWALESQFLRANYNLNNKYLLEGTVRRDGSSRFGANNKYGVFWAVSGGWIISEESFLKSQKFINLLKLTASYGTAGNDRIGDFSSQALYGGGIAADYAGGPGLRPIQVPNPALTWEETTQYDIGIASRFLDKRVSFNLNYYNKETKGILLNVPYPFTTGFASASQNVGRMRNRGIDVELNVDVVRSNDFTWSVGFNAGYLENRVLELPNAAVDLDGNKFVAGSAAQRAVEGRSLNEFFMVVGKGVNPQTGDYEWLKKDGTPTTVYSANDRVFVGSAIPKYVGGLNTNLGYKGFDLSVLFNFSYGNKVLIDGLRFTENLNSAAGFNKSANVLNYWKESGDNAFAPKLSSSTAPLFNQSSTLQLMNGSFLRLRNVQLGYNLPSSLIGKQKILQSARLFVLGQNLFLVKDKNFRGPDPEVSANGASNVIQGESFFALPQARVITFGLNVKF